MIGEKCVFVNIIEVGKSCGIYLVDWFYFGSKFVEDCNMKLI